METNHDRSDLKLHGRFELQRENSLRLSVSFKTILSLHIAEPGSAVSLIISSSGSIRLCCQLLQ